MLLPFAQALFAAAAPVAYEPLVASAELAASVELAVAFELAAVARAVVAEPRAVQLVRDLVARAPLVAVA